MYLDCEPYEDSSDHFTIECEPQCPDCHKMDVATRLMIGRPNKGPHFSVIHMAIGDISLYEAFHQDDRVKEVCNPNSGQDDKLIPFNFVYVSLNKLSLKSRVNYILNYA